MSDQTENPNDQATAKAQELTAAEAAKAQELTAAEAAKRVTRTVYVLEDGKERGKAVKVSRAKQVSVEEAEVLDFRDYGSHVVVITRDGQKLSSAKA